MRYKLMLSLAIFMLVVMGTAFAASAPSTSNSNIEGGTMVAFEGATEVDLVTGVLDGSEEPECNDGENNDADRKRDYYGACILNAEGLACDEILSDTSVYSTAGEVRVSCESGCNNQSGIYVGYDTECESEDDDSEAAEETETEETETEVSSCTSYTDCLDNEVCNEGVCIGFCGFGDAACSDGQDNDVDGGYDYYGACQVDGVVYTCYESEDVIGSVGQEYCYFYNAEGLLDFCDEYDSSAYLEADSDCVSPLDSSETAGVTTTGASASTDTTETTESTGTDKGEEEESTGPLGGERIGGPFQAAETDQGLLASFWDWLTFWN